MRKIEYDVKRNLKMSKNESMKMMNFDNRKYLRNKNSGDKS